MKDKTSTLKHCDSDCEHNIVSGTISQMKKDINFLNWFKNQIVAGYFPAMKLEYLDDFVTRLATWIEIKYQARKFAYGPDGEGTFNSYLTRTMNFDALKTGLTPSQLKLLECHYRIGSSWNLETSTIGFEIQNGAFKTLRLRAKEQTGIIVDSDAALAELLPSVPSTLTLEELHRSIENDPNLDLSILERILFTHRVDCELRTIIFEFVSLALLANSKDAPIVRRTRAKYWKEEVQNELNIELTDPSKWPPFPKYDTIDTAEGKRLRFEIASEIEKHYQQH